MLEDCKYYEKIVQGEGDEKCWGVESREQLAMSDREVEVCFTENRTCEQIFEYYERVSQMGVWENGTWRGRTSQCKSYKVEVCWTLDTFPTALEQITISWDLKEHKFILLLFWEKKFKIGFTGSRCQEGRFLLEGGGRISFLAFSNF